MKNQTSDDLSAGSSEPENDSEEYELLMTAEAEAILRSAVGQPRGSTTNEERREEEVNDNDDDVKKTQEEDDNDESKENTSDDDKPMESVADSNVGMEAEDNKDNDFAVGTREEVNGAAAFFFAAGFLIGGPIIGLGTSLLSSHLAANKTGPVANFCRKCGDLLDGIGKDKKEDNKNNRHQEQQQQPPPAATSQAIVVVAQPNHQTTEKQKGLWSKITDELVNGAEYVEGRLFVGAILR